MTTGVDGVQLQITDLLPLHIPFSWALHSLSGHTAYSTQSTDANKDGFTYRVQLYQVRFEFRLFVVHWSCQE